MVKIVEQQNSVSGLACIIFWGISFSRNCNHFLKAAFKQTINILIQQNVKKNCNNISAENLSHFSGSLHFKTARFVTTAISIFRFGLKDLFKCIIPLTFWKCLSILTLNCFGKRLKVTTVYLLQTFMHLSAKSAVVNCLPHIIICLNIAHIKTFV